MQKGFINGNTAFETTVEVLLLVPV